MNPAGTTPTIGTFKEFNRIERPMTDGFPAKRARQTRSLHRDGLGIRRIFVDSKIPAKTRRNTEDVEVVRADVQHPGVNRLVAVRSRHRLVATHSCDAG